MKLITKATNIFDRSLDVTALLAGVLLIYIMLAITNEIIIRSFLGRTMIALMEISEYALLYITFLGAAWVLRREGHVRMDLVISRLNPRAQIMLNIITAGLGAIAFLIITWYGIKVTWFLFETNYHMLSALRPIKWPIVGIIPVGSLLFSVQLLRQAYSLGEKWRALPSKKNSKVVGSV